MAKCSFPVGANIVRGHILYKIKTNDDVKLQANARIEPHGNEDNHRDQLRLN